ncbi:uracil-DNA glycosylase [Roseobacter sp.]|uniref:uracil-DNA glycosylase n=1 Tax=Roseobacter sp. TaxID=1907202 RepID=UPI0029666B2B|nr:uracil-DNA glycosylase [Roseobacter sp.]MDW3182659.1 uracil-DNA glycosylase [Roseobacter sp.]
MKRNAIDKFLSGISKVSLAAVFNPYRDQCELHDLPNAPQIRKENLEAALVAALKLKVRTLWIARDLGYRGGRRTGLALTDEAHLTTYSTVLDGADVRRSTHGPILKERTASVVWSMATRVKEPVFFWNAFPFHPHEAGEPMTNRCHTSAERRATNWALLDVLQILQPQQIFTIGGDAKKCLTNLGLETVSFRHPSYGGQNQFIREVEAAYGLENEAACKTDSRTKQLRLI